MMDTSSTPTAAVPVPPTGPDDPTLIQDPDLTLPHLPVLFDVHAHLTDTPTLLPHVHTQAHRTGTVALMGTRPDTDWPLILNTLASLASSHDRLRLVGGLGVHPWFAHTVLATLPATMAQLEAHLTQHPSLFVGEIGVDKAAKDPATGQVYDWDTQEQVFLAQWDVATRLQRPVSMHCVHAQGWVLRFFKAQADKAKGMSKQDVQTATCWPPAIMLHSFNGSPDLITQLVNLKGIGPRLYFSFSMFVSSRSAKVADRVRATPDARVLLESDVHRADWVDPAMANILGLVASAKGWSVEETARVAGRENAERWYDSRQSRE